MLSLRSDPPQESEQLIKKLKVTVTAGDPYSYKETSPTITHFMSPGIQSDDSKAKLESVDDHQEIPPATEMMLKTFVGAFSVTEKSERLK